MTTLRFLGCGDAFGSGGRHNTCFHVAAAGTAFLVDCGASSMVAIRRFGIDPNGIDTVFISHLHGDHFGGLPFLILDAQLVSRRTAPLTIVGPPGLRERLLGLMENFFPGSTQVDRRFALDIRELEPERRAVIGDVAVTPWVVRHASGAPPFALRFEVDGRVLAYSGDTDWVDALLPAAKGADLFVCEAYFYDRPVRYHLDFASLAPRLDEIGARRVILTHMSPDMLNRGDADFGACERAEDGLVVTF